MSTRLTYTSGALGSDTDREFEQQLSAARAETPHPLPHLVAGEERVEGIELTDTVTGETSTMPVSGLFVAIGHRPNTDVFKDVLEMDDNGYLVTKPGTTALSATAPSSAPASWAASAGVCPACARTSGSP